MSQNNVQTSKMSSSVEKKLPIVKILTFFSVFFILFGISLVIYDCTHKQFVSVGSTLIFRYHKPSGPIGKMNAFLKKSKSLLKLGKPMIIVLGNESCDLDSAISALSLAYFYSQSPQTCRSFIPNDIINQKSVLLTDFLPVFNVPRRLLPTKTEVTYFLAEHEIDVENVVCQEEIPLNIIAESKFILVDHHVSKFHENTIQIIDHHPFDSNSNIPQTCHTEINEVGSCATLIADLILNTINNTKTGSITERTNLVEILKLLYPVIVLDTVNFSVAADKVRPLDIAIGQKISQRLGVTKDESEKLFNTLVKVRAEVNTLDSLQILYKDLKIVTGMSGLVVGIPGFPILVEQYIKMPNFKENLQIFGKENNCSVILLMGMKVTDGQVQRDLAIININNEQLFKLIDNSINEQKYNLQLNVLPTENHTIYRFYQQINIKVSRKQILPIVKQILDNHQFN